MLIMRFFQSYLADVARIPSDETLNHLRKPIIFFSFVFIEVYLTYNVTSGSSVQHGGSTFHDQILNHLERVSSFLDTSFWSCSTPF